ncbi:MAG: hypothetical protein ACXWUG_28220 [Polyangiales bacterium]
MRARVLCLFLLALSGDFAGCSTQVTPNGTGGRCETDDQCDRNQGLVCRCLQRKNPDEEGGDEIISPGFCQVPTFKCSETGVATDVGVTDTGTPATDSGAAETAADAPDSTPDSAPDLD